MTRLDRPLPARGQRLGENDNGMAAPAQYDNEPIVTTDEDFGRVVCAGLPLKVVRYQPGRSCRRRMSLRLCLGLPGRR